MENLTSEFFSYIKEEVINSEEIYKRLDYQIVFDNRLTKTDLAIYLAILKESSFKDMFKHISHKVITEITGVAQPNQARAIDKLEELGYIEIQTGQGKEYKVNIPASNFLALSLESFDGLYKNVKNYIRNLKSLMLSNGNNKVPSIETCRKKLGKLNFREYKEYQAITNILDDIEIYKELNGIKIQKQIIARRITLDEMLDDLELTHENVY
tara:strand:- start:112 stop:744 length:633 start_codon:yes stop_codon:yes gene_type:complete